jgi:hypothetical protein
MQQNWEDIIPGLLTLPCFFKSRNKPSIYWEAGYSHRTYTIYQNIFIQKFQNSFTNHSIKTVATICNLIIVIMFVSRVLVMVEKGFSLSFMWFGKYSLCDSVQKEQ